MTNSNSSSTPNSTRVTLKLKGAPRKSPAETKASTIPPPQGKPSPKPGTHWSDEHKRRMQADMDELTSK